MLRDRPKHPIIPHVIEMILEKLLSNRL